MDVSEYRRRFKAAAGSDERHACLARGITQWLSVLKRWEARIVDYKDPTPHSGFKTIYDERRHITDRRRELMSIKDEFMDGDR